MRGLFKVILPPVAGFLVYFIALRYSGVYFTLKIDEMGDGTLTSFMAYFRYIMPLLFVVALLTQYVIINSIWDGLQGKSLAAKISSFTGFGLFCLLLAFCLSYVIWDKTTGTYHLIRLTCFMFAVQFVYWIINLIVLGLLTKRKPEPESTNE